MNDNEKKKREALYFHLVLSHIVIIVSLVLSFLTVAGIFSNVYILWICSFLAFWNILRLRVIERLLSRG